MTSTDPFGSGYVTGTPGEVPLHATGQEPAEYGVPVYGVPSDYRGTYDTSPANGDEASTVDVAKDQAASVASGAADAAQNVAGVAKEQVSQVAAEAGHQAQQLLGQAQAELSEQAAQQQQRVAAGLHDLGDQFGAMVKGSGEAGVAVDLARQAADKAHQVAGWLEDRDPGTVLDEVRSFARQRPGLFLALAVGAGLLAGRLARGLAADTQSTSTPSTGPTRSAVSVGSSAPSVGYGTEPAALTSAPPASSSVGGDLFPTVAAEGAAKHGWADPAVSAGEGRR